MLWGWYFLPRRPRAHRYIHRSTRWRFCATDHKDVFSTCTKWRGSRMHSRKHTAWHNTSLCAFLSSYHPLPSCNKTNWAFLMPNPLIINHYYFKPFPTRIWIFSASRKLSRNQMNTWLLTSVLSLVSYLTCPHTTGTGGGGGVKIIAIPPLTPFECMAFILPGHISIMVVLIYHPPAMPNSGVFCWAVWAPDPFELHLSCHGCRSNLGSKRPYWPSWLQFLCQSGLSAWGLWLQAAHWLCYPQ